MPFALAALALLLAGSLCLIYRLTVQLGRLQIRLEKLEPFPQAAVLDGLPRGSAAPDFELPLIGGGSMRLSAWQGREVLLIFFNPGCAHSLQLAPRFCKLDAERIDREPIPLIVSTGGPAKNCRLFQGSSIASRVMLQESFEVSTLYRVRGTPMGYFINREHKTGGNVLIGADTLGFALSAQSLE
jgi:peroxiredoxin